MNQAEQRLRNKITLMTFGCSLLVIWIHTYNLETYGITADSFGIAKITYWIENYWHKVTSICIPLFFLVSGFLFFRNYEPRGTLTKYKSRCKSVVLPYICWCSIYYLFFVAITNITGISNLMNHSDTIMFSIRTWLRWLGPDKYYTLWFLQNLMLYILICPILYCVLKNRRGIPLGTCLLVLGILNSYFKWWELPYGLIEYAFGAWIAINYKNAATYYNKYLTLWGWGYIVYLLLTDFRWCGMFGRLLFCVALWYALDTFSFEKDWPWWMKITFFTYVSHDIVLEIIQKLIFYALGNRPIWALVTYIFVPIFVFIILVFIATLLQRFLPRLWRILTGAR